jgi:hypothetical protein
MILPPPQPVSGAQPPTAKKNWFLRHKILSATLALVVLIAIISAAAGGSSSKNSNGSSGGSLTTTVQTQTTTPASKPTKPKSKPSLSGPQQQAVESAQSYLSEGTGFSRAGLIKQLSSSYGEGFPRAVAVFAVDHLDVNWYQQAVESAKGYKSEGSGFSCAGMIQQLSSSYGEGFTHAQATYAAHKVAVC